MEKKRQNIDNFFRENLSDLELSKKEANWELLNHLLNEQDRKKRNRKRFLLIFSFLFMLTSGLLLLLPIKLSKENKGTTVGHTNKPDQTENYPPIYRTTKVDATYITHENKTDDITYSNIKPVNPKVVTLAKEESSPIATTLRSESTQIPIVAKNNVKPTAETQTENNVNPIQPIVLKNESEKSNIDQADLSITPSRDELQSTDSINDEASLQQPSNQNLSSSELFNEKITGIDSTNSASENKKTADSTTAPSVAKRNLSLNLFAGANIYSTSKLFTSQTNISPLVGVEIKYPFNSKFSLGLAGLYSLQGGYHLNDTAIDIQQTYFLDKTENVYEQTIQVHQLHKLYFPMALYYSFDVKHSLSCAVQFTYVVNSIGNFTETNTNSGIINKSEKKDVKGYMDGIKSSGISASIGYQYVLSKTFDAGIHVTRELTDAYIKDYFYGIDSDASWSYQTFLILKF